MMKKITLIHLITGLHQGGAEAMLYKLLQHTDLDRYTPIVVSMTDQGVYGDKIQALGIRVDTLNLTKNPWRLLKGIQKFKKLLKQHHVDMVQSWMYHANLFATLANHKKQATKVVWNIRHSLHDLSAEKKTTQWVIKMNAKLSSKPEAIINNSKVSQQQHQAIGFQAKRDVYIGNGFDLEVFQPSHTMDMAFRQQYDLNQETTIIGNIARLHPMKNHIGLLEAFALVMQQAHQSIKLVMVGTGVDQENQLLIEKAQALGIDHHCLFLGALASSQVMPALDCYVSSSAWGEGFPNVIGEAMACGVPVVATNVGDSQTVVGHLGTVVPPDDSQALAKAIMEQLQCPKNPQALRQWIAQHYSIKSIAADYENLYQWVDQNA